MPIYEYSCKKCGEFEATQRMSEDPLKKCPTCGAKVTKLISQSAFHLKGSGWYLTDYAKNGTSSKSSSESKSPSDTKDSSSTDTSASSSKSSSPSTSGESPASA
ncbi:MAG: FmdB family zinc ribbon protein [Candidatus Binatia bacterium]